MWLDRNLGASRAATKVDDVLSYGDYYQAGRAADGHEKANSTMVYFEDVRTISPGTSSFYAPYKPNPDDGTTEVDPNRWDWLADGIDDSHTLRSAAWKDGGVNDICPAGYSVPTLSDFYDEIRKGGDLTFDSFLRVPDAGFRDVHYDKIFVGFSRFWTRTLHDEDGMASIHGGGITRDYNFQDSYRATTIRCIKE